MRGSIIKIVRLVKRNPNYNIDDAMPTSALVAMLWAVAMSLLRGMLRRPFIGQKRGLLFLGKQVTIRNPGMLHVGRSFVAEDYTEIQALSSDGVEIGDNVTMARFAMIRPSGYYGGELGVGFKIGDNSNIGAYSYMGAAGGIRIGSSVMMGPRVSILAEQHNFNAIDIPMKEQGTSRKGIVIEDDVWLGGNCVILDGVTVGRGAVVAAGAVVNKDVPQFAVVGGVPAKVLKLRIDQAKV